jgi:hypothetical protein
MRKLSSTVEFSIPVSDAEKKAATLLRDALSEFSDSMDDFKNFFEAFSDSVSDVQVGADLMPIVEVVIRYVYKMRQEFNECVLKLSVVLAYANNVYNESKTDQIKDTLVGAFDELRLSVIELINLCEDLSNEKFKDKATKLIDSINLYMDKAVTVAHDEWIAHIDRHILGRVRLT